MEECDLLGTTRLFMYDVVYGFVNLSAYKMNPSQFQSAGFRFVQKFTV